MQKLSVRKKDVGASLLGGVCGAGGVAALLMIAAALSDRLPRLIDAAVWLSRVSLMLGAAVCAAVTGKRTPCRKALFVSAGEGILVLLLLTAHRLTGSVGTNERAIWNAVSILFGTFAGIAVVCRRKQHHHRQRLYSS